MNNNDKIFNFSGPLKPDLNFGQKNLYSRNHFSILVNQLGVQACSVILGVHRTTISRWVDGTVQVPRHVVLALYWESPWGRSLVDSDHMRALNLLYNHISSLKDENTALKAAIAEMEKYIDNSAANSPVFDIEKKAYAVASVAPEPRKPIYGPPPRFPMKPKR